MKEENHAIWGPRLREVKKYEEKDRFLKDTRRDPVKWLSGYILILKFTRKKSYTILT